jgi:hypothetical protein
MGHQEARHARKPTGLRVVLLPQGRSGLPVKSRPGQGRASGVRCTAWLGCAENVLQMLYEYTILAGENEYLL